MNSNTKVEALTKLPPPTNLREPCQFLELTSYFRHFIQNFAMYAIKHFHNYLQSYLFTVITDCASLQAAQDIKNI